MATEYSGWPLLAVVFIGLVGPYALAVGRAARC